VLKLDLAHRSTTEIVVLMLTALISVVLLIMVLGAVTARILYPQMELLSITEAVSQMLSTIIGGVVGFISGRAYGRHEQVKVDNCEKDRHH
jgi:hypothetical protein